MPFAASEICSASFIRRRLRDGTLEIYGMKGREVNGRPFKNPQYLEDMVNSEVISKTQDTICTLVWIKADYGWK